MKKILFLFLVFFITFLIYYFNVSNKIYYFSIDNYGYSKNIEKSLKSKLKNSVIYSKEDYRIMDLINDIEDNKEFIYSNKTYNFDNLLVKANYITISIGMDDLLYKKEVDYNYIDQLIFDIEKLLVLIRKYNKDRIYFLSLYKSSNLSEVLEYANKKIENLCKKNKINYIDIGNLTVINKTSNLYISNEILNFTKK